MRISSRGPVSHSYVARMIVVVVVLIIDMLSYSDLASGVPGYTIT